MNLVYKTSVLVLLLTFLVNAQNQCQAITKKGTQCKRKAVAGSIFCAQHSKMSGVKTVIGQSNPQGKTQKNETVKQIKNQSENSQCQTFTKKGKQCSRKAKTGSKYCWQHQNFK